MPIAITHEKDRPNGRTRRTALTGLASNTPPTVPDWAKSQMDGDTLVGVGILGEDLCALAGSFRPDTTDSRLGVAEWTAPDECQLTLELLIPLMALARDLRELGEKGNEFVLDGS